MKSLFAFAALSAAMTAPALAAPGDPVDVGGGLALDPIVEGRLRWEHVDTPTLGADAVTARLRAGAELRQAAGLAILAEAEGTLAIADHYNAFPFPISSSQRRTSYAVVPDPMNVDLNRLQIQYKSKPVTGTIGRQRINLDDQRFVGSVGWRQNEQTFDAARLEANIGPARLDGTYAISQRTIFGIDAGPRRAYDGKFWFLQAGAVLGPVQAKTFAYLLDYDPAAQPGTLAAPNADTQTYGVRLTGSFPIGRGPKLGLIASYAHQSNYAGNPARYGVDYVLAEASLANGPLTASAGFEKLGGTGLRAFQTPMATLHKFNGWADLFLTTPSAGLKDWYGGLGYSFKKVTALPGLNASVTFHRFESDVGSLHYGDEWDAALGFKIKRMAILAKYAHYDAAGFAADKRVFWLQAEFAY